MKLPSIVVLMLSLPFCAARAQGKPAIVIEQYVHGDLAVKESFFLRLDSRGTLSGVEMLVEGPSRAGSSVVFSIRRIDDSRLAIEGVGLPRELRRIGPGVFEYSYTMTDGKTRQLLRYSFSDKEVIITRTTTQAVGRGQTTVATYSILPEKALSWEESEDSLPLSRGGIRPISPGKFAYSLETYHDTGYEREWFGEASIADTECVLSMDSNGDGQGRILFTDVQAMARLMRDPETLTIILALSMSGTGEAAFCLLLAMLNGALP